MSARIIIAGLPSLAAALDTSPRKISRMDADGRLLAADGKCGRCRYWLVDRVRAWCAASMPSREEWRAIEGERK